jgi:hypothetical protein
MSNSRAFIRTSNNDHINSHIACKLFGDFQIVVCDVQIAGALLLGSLRRAEHCARRVIEATRTPKIHRPLDRNGASQIHSEIDRYISITSPRGLTKNQPYW